MVYSSTIPSYMMPGYARAIAKSSAKNEGARGLRFTLPHVSRSELLQSMIPHPEKNGRPPANRSTTSARGRRTRIGSRTRGGAIRLICSLGLVIEWSGPAANHRPGGSWRLLLSRALNNYAINFLQKFSQTVAKSPGRIVFLKLSYVADPPDVVADSVRLLIAPS